MRKLTLVAALAAVLALATASVAAAHPFDRDDGGWRTYVLASGAAIDVPAPPRNHSAQTRAELATLEADQAAREASPAIQAQIARWDAQPAFAPWTKKALALIAANATSTAKAQRVMALVHVAMNDATVAAWHWKQRYHRPSPARLDRALTPSVTSANVPSYPSEHAVLAGAAAAVLKALYPADATIASDAQEAADSRLFAGTNYPSDVAAGLALGEAVAAQVLAAAAGDNLGTGQPGRLPGGDCEATPAGCQDFWEPTFPRTPPASPTDPFAGTWHTWVIGSARDFLPPAPPWFRAGPPPSVDVPTLEGGRARRLRRRPAHRRADGRGRRAPSRRRHVGRRARQALERDRARPRAGRGAEPARCDRRLGGDQRRRRRRDPGQLGGEVHLLGATPAAGHPQVRRPGDSSPTGRRRTSRPTAPGSPRSRARSRGS